MKRFIIVLSILTIGAMCLAGCGKTDCEAPTDTTIKIAE